jgi:hypothetical protein
MSTRFQIAALVFMMTNAVAFGIGIVPILMIPRSPITRSRPFPLSSWQAS